VESNPIEAIVVLDISPEGVLQSRAPSMLKEYPVGRMDEVERWVKQF